MSALAMDKPSSAADAIDMEAASDPFTGPAQAGHHRFANFDQEAFATQSTTSPDQAKRALQAHIAETERRIQEASTLGTTLLRQRKDLADRLKDVEDQQTGQDITPELRQKLLEIEREYNDVGRDTARALLPKSRVASSEVTGTPHAAESKRNISPHKFESQATGSPTKLSVPNRKQRNQASTRVHDIEFATEISTSLLSQVRNLQALLAEKEESLRAVNSEKSKLEMDAEGFSQRLRTLNESEQRYKDENWNLETQIHEHLAAAKEAADREKKLSHNFSIVQSEKSAAQKELDEIKVSHAKLSDDHTSFLKQHDIEMGTIKRNATMAENDRSSLQRKVDELTSQNQELAKAVASQRGRHDDRDTGKVLSDEDFETATDNLTPDEGSPPASPMKGATPRHGMLESETLKSSLHHAHRMIQNLKGNIHREKTEKLELKRMLQDARDELEARRGDGNLGSGTKRSRKVESKEFKKPPRPGQLGGLRNSKSEVLDDAHWEEDDGQRSPSHTAVLAAKVPTGAAGVAATGALPHALHRTETDTSDAFETANERGTETEEFQTGAEEMSSDDLTETEAGAIRTRPKPAPLAMRESGNRQSFLSTASNSGDEYNYDEAKTPTVVQPQRMRLKVNRASHRRSRQPSEDPQIQSPGSIANSSIDGTPNQQPGQSLFSELGDLGGSDEEYQLVDTPSRSRVASPPVASATNTPPIVTMVDTATMTEPWEPEPLAASSTALVMPHLDPNGESYLKDSSSVSTTASQPELAPPPPRDTFLHVDSPILGHARPVSAAHSDMSSQYDPEIMDERLASFPSPPVSRSHTPMDALNMFGKDSVPLKMSSILSKDVEPYQGPSFLESPESPMDPSFPHHARDHAPLVVPQHNPMAMSTIQAVNIEPLSPSQPLRTAYESFGQSHQMDRSASQEDAETPRAKSGVSRYADRSGATTTPLMIAEDETRQSPSLAKAESPGSQRPFQELSNNVVRGGPPTRRISLVDESSQTALTAQQIDDMMSSSRKKEIMLEDSGFSGVRVGAIPPPLRIHKSQESIGSVGRTRGGLASPEIVNDTTKKPTSPTSMRSNSVSSAHPPLPMDHRQVIAAAAQRSTSSQGLAPAPVQQAGSGSMGPPVLPASAFRANPSFRPRTPSQQMSSAASHRAGNTPRALHSSSGVADMASPNRSRRSSVTSFTSEVNHRFNMGDGNLMPHGLEPGTDPRMIHAITQTMIGEYLWKYTRKAGRGGMSENRHRRYFWIHPYTRTLYWSDRDPSTAGRAELKAKSVAIEAVRVVTDDNPMPPGLHRKSLVIMTPGRAVKFTATTGQRHETWFNALSYLLLRTGDDQLGDTAEVAGALTADDVSEFMGYGHSARRGPMSMASYNSRTTRNESPGRKSSVRRGFTSTNNASAASRTSMGTLSRLSNYWKPGRDSQTGTHRSRRSMSNAGSIYEASEVHDSAEDLRQVIEKQDMESDKLENVRACCDGKHDVGHLHNHNSTRSRHSTTQNSAAQHEAAAAAAASTSSRHHGFRHSLSRRTE